MKSIIPSISWLPIWTLLFLSKKYQDKWVQKKWDNRSDESILAAYEDSDKWIMLADRMKDPGTVQEVADDCKLRLKDYIMPQVNKRKLSVRFYYEK